MKYTLLTASLFLIGSLFSQTFTNYTTADGLVSNSVNCVDVDANNDVWFGTQSGVSVFDGTTWTTHSTTTDAGFIDNNVQAIHCAANGNVWIGTDFGASKYDGTSWTSYTTTSGLGNNQIKCITEDAAGAIWFGTNTGASKFNGTTWTNIGTAQGLPFGGVNEIDILSNGDVWLGTGLSGIRVYTSVISNQITTTNGLIDDRIRAMVMDAQGRKWIGTAEGISVLDNSNAWMMNHTTLFLLPPPDTLNPIEDLEMDSHGNIWAGVYVDYLVTEGGVSVYDGSQWLQFDITDGLIGPVVRALAIDDNDDVWVATSTGVSKISDASIGLAEMNSQSVFDIFPNPAEGKITVRYEVGNSDAQVEIYALSMQQVGSFALTGTTTEIDINALPAGMYFVKIGGKTKKLLKR